MSNINESVRGPNRKPATLLQVINPFWLLSDDEQNSNYPWLRWLTINPFMNFLTVVIGICHRTRYIRTYRSKGWTFADDGLNYGYSIPSESALVRPFVSYRWNGFRIPFTTRRFRGLEWKLGWETNGSLAVGTFRIANAKNTAEKP